MTLPATQNYQWVGQELLFPEKVLLPFKEKLGQGQPEGRQDYFPNRQNTRRAFESIC